MSLFPKKKLIWAFDSVVPSKYVHKCRRFFFFDPFYGNDLSTRGRLSHYGSDERKAFAKDLKKIRSETELLIEDIEAYHIYMAVKRTCKVPGDIAEVGVYKGGSARIICSVKGDKHLHLFDTFEGLPQVDEIDMVWPFYEGKFAASYDRVCDYLKHETNISFYKGVFPETAGPVENKTFSLVNLDVDCYESTKQCLEFFYSRMNPGGIILSHDYTTTPGVRKAFDDFFEKKVEPVLETAGSQCLVVKV
ncbi:MAG TPA: TylF/MycF/NovP-related O-methyltransferase [Methanoregula sp.]|nr:TylF/MycF/NovP-related O-methyltransferase [Methanoregula sp.]